MKKSTVKWFDAKKGYGFLDHPSGGDDVFVHYSQIVSTKDFKTLRTGQEVQFDLSDGPKGLHALDVKPLEEDGEGTKKADGDDESTREEQRVEAPADETSAAGASTTGATTETQADDSDDEWGWDEEWTDEHGNPPDPMASPSF